MTRTLNLRILGLAIGVIALLAAPAPARAAAWPTYAWTAQPSPVVLFPAHHQLVLHPYAYCWNGPRHAPGGSTASCGDGIPPKAGKVPATWHRRAIRFWFGRPGWTFTGRMHTVNGCIRLHQRAHVRRIAPKQFMIRPPWTAGNWRVELLGKGPEGDVSVVFKWHYQQHPGVFAGPACL